jgi:hypothetical protein
VCIKDVEAKGDGRVLDTRSEESTELPQVATTGRQTWMMTAGLDIPVAPRQTASANHLAASCFKTPPVQSGEPEECHMT